jgi:hypothetical protein
MDRAANRSGERTLTKRGKAVRDMDKTFNDGGSAFPQVRTKQYYVTDIDVHSVGGMTLRDYFAAKAMHAIMLHPSSNGKDSYDITMNAYEIADAMLSERAKAKGGDQ